MKNENIKDAIEEAKRFIKLAEACISARKFHVAGDSIFHIPAPKESGAARRASMDLTRKLAEMRKP